MKITIEYAEVGLSEEEAVVQSLYSRHFHKGLAHDQYLRWIDDCSAAYLANEAFAPYFPMLQSSGVGKTMLVVRTAQEGSVLGLYILCKPAMDREVSPFVKKLMQVAVNSTVEDLVDFIAISLARGIKLLLHYHGRDPNANYMAGPYLNAAMLKKQVGFWELVFSGTCMEDLPLPDSLGGQPVVIAFDEAGELSSRWSRTMSNPVDLDEKMLFRALRAALVRVADISFIKDRGIKFCAVMLDTTSSIANYYPLSDIDRLLSEGRPHDSELFAPLLAIDTFDLVDSTESEGEGNLMDIDYSQDPMASDDDQDSVHTLISRRASSSEQAIKLLVRGRPLWKTLFDNLFAKERERVELPANELESDSLWMERFDYLHDELLELALRRINPSISSRGPHMAHHLAPIAARIPLRYSGVGILSELMMSNYLATAYHCSPDRDFIKVIFREEAILGAAYARYFWQAGSGGENEAAAKSLDSLRHYLIGASDELGFHGEFAVQLLLTAAIDHASGGRPHIGCQMDQLLHSFISPSVTLEVPFANARVAFTQFIRAVSRVDHVLIRWAIRSCIAIAPIGGNAGYDLLIPFETPQHRIGLLFVQAKNHNDRYLNKDKVLTGLKQHIQQAQDSNYEAFAIVVSLAQGQKDPMKVWIVNSSTNALDSPVDLMLSATNTWGNPSKTLEVIRLASQTRLGLEESLLPQSRRITMRTIDTGLVKASFAKILRSLLHMPSQPLAPLQPKSQATPNGDASASGAND